MNLIGTRHGEKQITEIADYNSHNTTRLSIDDTKKITIKTEIYTRNC
ncbi:MAG: hypothetical protein ACL7AY_15375 [Candidatus Arsenophonus phytopathogenicus]